MNCPVCDWPILGETHLDDHSLWPDRPWIEEHEGGRFCALTDKEARRERDR